MPIVKRRITVLFRDRCGVCRRPVQVGETAFLDEMMKLTCSDCNKKCEICPICATIRLYDKLLVRIAKWNWWRIIEITINLVIIIPISCLALYGAYKLGGG